MFPKSTVKRIPNLVPFKEVIELTLTPIIGIPCFVLVFTVLGVREILRMPTKMSDSLSQGIADKYCSLHIAHLALTSHCVVILSSLYDIERAGVTGKYTQVSSAIFSVASSCCPFLFTSFGQSSKRCLG